MKGFRDSFRCFAQWVSGVVGSPWAFGLALLVCLGWATTGPLFGFSDTWQLVINTGTTIVTFLMVFLIQNMQNRDALAIHLKLDELLRAVTGARNKLVDLERLPDDEIAGLQEEFAHLHARARERTTIRRSRDPAHTRDKRRAGRRRRGRRGSHDPRP